MSARAATGNRPGARFAQFKLVLLGKPLRYKGLNFFAHQLLT